MNRHFVSPILLFVLALSRTSCGGMDFASLHSAITVEINGESTSIPVTVYEGDDYFTYIPDEGDYWVDTENKHVFFKIAICLGQKLEDTREDIFFVREPPLGKWIPKTISLVKIVSQNRWLMCGC